MAQDTSKAVIALTDLTMKFDEAVRRTEPIYPLITTMFQSRGSQERYAMLGAMPQVREWLGERVKEKLRAFDQTVVNRLWESTLQIEKTDIEDDRVGMYIPLAEDLGANAAAHPDDLLTTDLVANTWTCMDGVALFSDSHSWGGNTVDNNLGYTVSSTTAVTAAEMKSAINAARAAMLGFVDDNNKPLIRPRPGGNSWVVMVPPELEQATHEALQATVLSNNTNVVIDSYRIITNTYLTSAVKFYLFNVNNGLRPVIFQARTPLQRQMKNLDDLEDKDALLMTRARYAIAPGAFWNASLTTLS